MVLVPKLEKGGGEMLIGEYSHSLDEKSRVNFPAKLRADLGEEFILTKGLDGCVFVYAKSEFEKLEERIRQLPMSKSRNLQRFLFSGAVCVNADKQGRVLIPQNLREYANLNKDVAIIGASSRAEIWDKETWDKSCLSLSPESISDAMDELGF